MLREGRAKIAKQRARSQVPKIFNTSWLAVFLATIVFYLIGFTVYGILFHDIWLAASGMTQAQTEALAQAQGPMIFVWGLLLTIAQALGLLWVLSLAGATRLGSCLSCAFWLFMTICAPLLAYNCCLLYTSPSPRDATLSRMPSSA